MSTCAPLLVETPAELRAELSDRSGSVVLVPTMGALHQGHAALLRRARVEAGAGPVVASVFVNPLQFAPGEDLDRYPRTLSSDLDICAAAGADVVFAPAVEEVYPGGDPVVTVDPGPLGAILEGVTRPTHFRGVLTVVAKLFGLVCPDIAVFGQKDYQQLVLIRRMAAELCMGVTVVGAETFRQPDGLALSSRNSYLSVQEQDTATVLSRALYAGQDEAATGREGVLKAARDILGGVPGVELDYLALTDPELGPDPGPGPARLLVAARVGSTRLIDNVALDLGGD